jgi:cytoskeletal protein RodZ
VADPSETREKLAAFGRWLTRERELRGLSRGEVVRGTKLAPGVIEALESGEEGRIPPRAYAIGYLRAYAAAVGLAADEVVLRFEEALGSAEPTGGRRPTPIWARVAVIGAIFVAAAVAAWTLLRP